MRRQQLLLLLLTVAACEESGAQAPRSNLTPPLNVGGRLVQLDQGRSQVWVFDADSAAGTLSRRKLQFDGDAEVWSVAGQSLFLLTSLGHLVEIDPESAAVVHDVDLGGRFDSLEVSADGRFVIAWSASGQGDPDDILLSPNRLSIVDLAQPMPAATPVTLADSAPLGFVFAPPFTLGDAAVELRMAVVLGDGAVSLLALEADAPDRQRIIPLVEPGRGTAVAREVAFSSDDPDDPFDLTMFVRAVGAEDIFAIDLLPPEPGSGRSVQPAINQLTTTRSPATMRLFQVDGREKLLVLSATGQAAVVDVESNTSVVVDLGAPYSTAVLWSDDEGGVERPKALLWGIATTLMLVDLSTIERQGVRAARIFPLDVTPEGVELVDTSGARKAIVRHSGGLGLDVLNLETNRVVSLPARVNLTSFQIVGDRVFAAAAFPPRLVTVDLVTATPEEFELAAAGAAVFVVGDSIVVEHEPWVGWLSAYRIADLAAGPYADAYGYALEGVLDGAEGTR